MIRELALVSVVVAMVAVPMPATARAGGHEAERDEGHRALVYPYSVSACFWQPEYWANQLYADGAGGYRYEPVWVPARYVCY